MLEIDFKILDKDMLGGNNFKKRLIGAKPNNSINLFNLSIHLIKHTIPLPLTFQPIHTDILTFTLNKIKFFHLGIYVKR